MNMRLNAQLLSLMRGESARTIRPLNHTTRPLSSTTRTLSDNIKKGLYRISYTRQSMLTYETEDQNEILNKHLFESSSTSDSADTQSQHQQQPPKAKSVSQSDEELREKLERMSGGGGASGIECEDGKPSTMKRSVRNNMFRYI